MKLFKNLKRFCNKIELVNNSEITANKIRKNYLKGFEKIDEENISKQMGDVNNFNEENF
jgi:hypothetical protein